MAVVFDSVLFIWPDKNFCAEVGILNAVLYFERYRIFLVKTSTLSKLIQTLCQF